MDTSGRGTRLAELLAALSLATDMGNGSPPEKTLRMGQVSMILARELGLEDSELADLYYACLVRFVGCTSFSYEIGRAMGDEHAALRAFSFVDDQKPTEAIRAVRTAAKSAPAGQHARTLFRGVVQGKSLGEYVVRVDCEANVRFAQRFGLPGVAAILADAYERWDGKGGPRGLQADAIALGARVLAVASQIELSISTGGPEQVGRMLNARSGGWFDPGCVVAFHRCSKEIFAALEGDSAWEETLDAEPKPWVFASGSKLDDIAECFADFTDLKSPCLLGHSRHVATLACDAGRLIGLKPDELTNLRHAALMHDLGRLAVASRVWEKPRPLSEPEREQVRLHAYHTERVLSHAASLGPVAALAGAHHERMDGSGYHRGVLGAALDRSARILAAADMYAALTEERPYRPAFNAADAAAEMRSAVAEGLLDPEAATAVCAAGGTSFPRIPRSRPAGLTEREVEVLRLLARGKSKKEIARELVIAAGTVHTHVTHIYEKIGTSSRAGAAVFAMTHDLIRP